MSYLQVSVASNMTSYCCSFSLLQDSTWPIPSLNQSPLCYYLGIYCNFWFNTGNRPCEINVQSTGAIFLLKPHAQTACWVARTNWVIFPAQTRLAPKELFGKHLRKTTHISSILWQVELVNQNNWFEIVFQPEVCSIRCALGIPSFHFRKRPVHP